MALNLYGEEGYVSRMVQGSILFDRALLRSRQRRAQLLAPSRFLLERVAEDAADRLATILRRFELALDLATPGDTLRRALAVLPDRQRHYHNREHAENPQWPRDLSQSSPLDQNRADDRHETPNWIEL